MAAATAFVLLSTAHILIPLCLVLSLGGRSYPHSVAAPLTRCQVFSVSSNHLSSLASATGHSKRERHAVTSHW